MIVLSFQGDRGSPLAIVDKETNKTVHLAMFSFRSTWGCDAGIPSGFTRTYMFLDWIHNKTGVPVPE